MNGNKEYYQTRSAATRSKVAAADENHLSDARKTFIG
jgi:hypothetical protein